MRLIFWLLAIPGALITYGIIGFFCYILVIKIEAKVNNWSSECTWRTELQNGYTDGLWACLIFWWFIIPIMCGWWIVDCLNKLFKKIAEVSEK